MARLLFTLLPALLCSVLSLAQPRISSYEWWLDGDFDARNTAAGNKWESPLDMSTLHEGLHCLAVRAVQQSDGETRYSPVLTHHFIVPSKPVIRDNNLASYEWWIDGDFDSRKGRALSHPQAVIDLDLDMSTLHEGLHCLAVRMLDDQGVTGAVITRHFIVPCKPVVRDNNLTSYEWWLDGDFAARKSGKFSQSQSVIDLNLDMSALHEGLHSLAVRVLDKQGAPSPLLTRHFIVPCKPVVCDNSIASYEWWLDGDFAARKSGKFSQSQPVIALDLDMSALHEGLHSLAVRVLDKNGVPSPLLTRHFIVPCKPVVRDNSIVSYEWWLDGDFESRVSSTWPASGTIDVDLDMSSLVPGAHSLSYRITDATGDVGAVMQSHFIVPDIVVEAEENPLIVAYGYWFNHMPRVMVNVDPPVRSLKLTNVVIPLIDIVPNHIKPDEYRFDVATQRVIVTDDVFFGLQVFNDAELGSNAARDTLKALEVAVDPHLQTIASGQHITLDTPAEGHVQGFVYEGYEGDNLQVTVEGTDVHVDFVDQQGNVMETTKTVNGDKVVYTVVATSDDTYILVYDASGELAKNTISLNVYINGDINDDRIVDVADLSCVINAVLGRPDPNIVNSVDLNHDGMVDVSDVALEINLILGSPRNTRQRVPSR